MPTRIPDDMVGGNYRLENGTIYVQSENEWIESMTNVAEVVTADDIAPETNTGNQNYTIGIDLAHTAAGADYDGDTVSATGNQDYYVRMPNTRTVRTDISNTEWVKNIGADCCGTYSHSKLNSYISMCTVNELKQIMRVTVEELLKSEGFIIGRLPDEGEAEKAFDKLIGASA